MEYDAAGYSEGYYEISYNNYVAVFVDGSRVTVAPYGEVFTMFEISGHGAREVEFRYTEPTLIIAVPMSIAVLLIFLALLMVGLASRKGRKVPRSAAAESGSLVRSLTLRVLFLLLR